MNISNLHKNKYTTLALLVMIILLLSACPKKASMPGVKDTPKPSSKITLPSRTIKQLMIEVGKNYLIINMTIEEHNICTGIAERAAAIVTDVKDIHTHLKYKKSPDQDFIIMINAIENSARKIKIAAQNNDVVKTKDLVKNWKKYASFFQ